jgi:predicted permease
MRWLTKTLLRLRSLFRKSAVDRELDDELRFHLERQIEENVAAGMPPAEARRAALRDFGGVAQVKEECRDARGVTLLHDLAQDVRYALRMMQKNAGFTAVAVLTLALGIGANTAIFSLIDGVMLRGLPARDPEELVVLKWSAHATPRNGSTSSYGDCPYGEGGGPSPAGCSFSLPFLTELRSRNLMSGMAAFAGAPRLQLGGNGPASFIDGQLVSGDYFATLGVRAALGRTLAPEDDTGTAPPVAVLNHRAWRRAFGADPAAVGKTIRLNGVTVTIVGVAEPSFVSLTPGIAYDVWLPLSLRPRIDPHWNAAADGAGAWWLVIIGRLGPGLRARAEAAISLLYRNEVVHGATPLLDAAADPRVELEPADRALTGSRGRYSRQLIVLMAAVGIVLSIACANVAGLMLARASARRREMAVRLALGAGRGRIVRQLLTESVLIALLGGALGAALAGWGVGAIVSFATAAQSGAGFAADVNGRVLLFTAAISIVTGIVFGLAPAFRGTRLDLASALKQGPASPAGARSFGLGSALVVAQVALSILVLVAAGLLARTLGNLRAIDSGFDTRNMLVFGIDPSRSGYKSAARVDELYRDLQSKLAALPGVTSVSYSSMSLLSGSLMTTSVRLDGPRVVDADYLHVSPHFFETLDMPLLAGRAFSSTDSPAAAATVGAAVVNETFVRRYLPGMNPVGHRFELDDDEPRPALQIVGVVRDAKYNDLRRDIQPTLYVPAGGHPPTADVPVSGGGVHFEVRAAAAASALIAEVRDVVARIDTNLALFDVKTEAEQVDQLLYKERLLARLSGLFGLLALALSCIGLYALLSYEVTRRSREVGIRMALGAQGRDVRRMVVRQGLTLAAAGIAFGTAGAWAITRYLVSLLYGVSPMDPLTLAGVAALLLAVAFAACYLPARRATRVDPMVALRSD